MRLLAVMYRPTQLWAFGGSERRFAAMTRELRLRHSVEYETIEPFPPLSWELPVNSRSHIIKLPRTIDLVSLASWVLAGALLLRKLRHDRNYDIIYSTNNNLYNLALAHVASRLMGVPLLAVVHHFRWVDYRVAHASERHRFDMSRTFRLMREQGLSIIDSLYRAVASALENILVVRADGCIVPTETVAAQVRALGFSGMLRCVGNGVNPHPQDASQIETNPPFDAVYVGRIDEGKGILTLLSVWERTCRSRPRAKLAIVGTGRLLEKTKRRIAKLQLKDNVALIGHQSDAETIRIMRSARLFVSLSTVEGWGIALAEALSQGLPAIAAKTPPLAEVYANCGAVFLTDPSQPNVIAGLISGLLKLSDNDRRKLARAANEYVKQFSWEYASEREYEALLELAGRSGNSDDEPR